MIRLICCCFFFKHKTAYEMRISDWSSDVCSSDLLAAFARIAVEPEPQDQKQDAEGARIDEGFAPVEAEYAHAQGDRGRGQDDADRRRAVDPADRIGAFLLREPFARRADDRREKIGRASGRERGGR